MVLLIPSRSKNYAVFRRIKNKIQFLFVFWNTPRYESVPRFCLALRPLTLALKPRCALCILSTPHVQQLRLLLPSMHLEPWGLPNIFLFVRLTSSPQYSLTKWAMWCSLCSRYPAPLTTLPLISQHASGTRHMPSWRGGGSETAPLGTRPKSSPVCYCPQNKYEAL